MKPGPSPLSRSLCVSSVCPNHNALVLGIRGLPKSWLSQRRHSGGFGVTWRPVPPDLFLWLQTPDSYPGSRPTGLIQGYGGEW